jgi:hypothetical protein
MGLPAPIGLLVAIGSIGRLPPRRRPRSGVLRRSRGRAEREESTNRGPRWQATWAPPCDLAVTPFTGSREPRGVARWRCRGVAVGTALGTCIVVVVLGELRTGPLLAGLFALPTLYPEVVPASTGERLAGCRRRNNARGRRSRPTGAVPECRAGCRRCGAPLLRRGISGRIRTVGPGCPSQGGRRNDERVRRRRRPGSTAPDERGSPTSRVARRWPNPSGPTRSGTVDRPCGSSPRLSARRSGRARS